MHIRTRMFARTGRSNWWSEASSEENVIPEKLDEFSLHWFLPTMNETEEINAIAFSREDSSEDLLKTKVITNF